MQDQVQAAAAQKFNADAYIRANTRRIYGWIKAFARGSCVDADEIFGDASLRLFLQQDDFDAERAGPDVFAKVVTRSAVMAYFKAKNRREQFVRLVDISEDDDAPEADIALRGGDFDADDCDVDMPQRVANFDLELRKELRLQSPALLSAYNALGGLEGLGAGRDERKTVAGYQEDTLRKHIASIKKVVIDVWPAHFDAALPFAMALVPEAVEVPEVAPVEVVAEAAEVAVAAPAVAANDALVIALPAAAIQLDLFADAPAAGQLELFPLATVRSLAEQRALRRELQAAAVASACSRAAPIADGGAPVSATVHSLDKQRRRRAAERVVRAENLVLFAPSPGAAEPPGAVVEPARLVRTA